MRWTRSRHWVTPSCYRGCLILHMVEVKEECWSHLVQQFDCLMDHILCMFVVLQIRTVWWCDYTRPPPWMAPTRGCWKERRCATWSSSGMSTGWISLSWANLTRCASYPLSMLLKIRPFGSITFWSLIILSDIVPPVSFMHYNIEGHPAVEFGCRHFGLVGALRYIKKTFESAKTGNWINCLIWMKWL